jgi:uncharacterized protein (DUF58 family)
MLIGLALWALFGITASLMPEFVPAWQVGGAFLLLLGLYEAYQLRKIPVIHCERVINTSLSLGEWQDVSLKLYAAQNYRLHVFDDYPVTADIWGLPQAVWLPPERYVYLQYQLCPKQRGTFELPGVHVLLHSPLRLWTRPYFLPVVSEIKVYPNFAAVTKYALLATENRLGQLGIRKLQRRGEGLDFHQLREYRLGDSMRQIDWNATARQKKLISKEYQDERDQQIVFLLDCGQRMLAKDGELSHFDHTLNAILLLSYVALRQGDALGLQTFSGMQRWIAPRKGHSVIKTILNGIYDLEPTLQTSDYLSAAERLMQRQKRRALIILISNLRDQESDELIPALHVLKRKHLVLVASLQESIISQERDLENFDDALRYAAIQDYLHYRNQAHHKLEKHGILYLDTVPEQLPIKLINRYLDIKRGGRL